MDIEKWVPMLVEKLSERFGPRLLFLGLQGSYQRGEAGEHSDVDIVAVLDTLDVRDLCRYREALAEMPEREKACGFICGREELFHWPKHEIFQLKEGTDPLVGSLDGLLSPVSRADMADSVRIGASALYHETCHRFLYDGLGRVEHLRSGYKSAFFLLQCVDYLRTGIYSPTKAALRPRLSGQDRWILDAGADWDAGRPEREADPLPYFDRLIRWSGGLLSEFNDSGSL